MDQKMIFMIVVAIVLGMLLANMLKDVCGCKNLIEGQCPGAPDDCQWTDSVIGVCDFPSQPLPNQITVGTSGNICAMSSAVPLGIVVPNAVQADALYWKDTPCCRVPPPPQSPTLNQYGCIVSGQTQAAANSADTTLLPFRKVDGSGTPPWQIPANEAAYRCNGINQLADGTFITSLPLQNQWCSSNCGTASALQLNNQSPDQNCTTCCQATDPGR